ncbi:alpha/beta hydrolase [Agarilytica rhodophyticola]|uniref:alpha/beta hydrolase n=1 Tax=Agarilytica rhodophyticola TaxID=1737490 RepID=UPI000CD98FEC|nr:CocE/NonD family hydrolase [Agarilytica rhodophyticola]
MPKTHLIRMLVFIAAFISATVYAAVEYPKAVVPESVEKHKITIWSDGRGLDGDIYRPKNLAKDEKVPAIVTSHGWGGNKETAARYAIKFAQEGFIVLTFTHNTWGNSAGNIIVKDVNLALDKNGDTKANVHLIRNVVDPVDWVNNIRSAIDYLAGEPNVDIQRIGAWGTSFGGGVTLAAVAGDSRIAALVTQVGAFPELAGANLAHAQKRAIDIARGNLPAIPENLDAFPGLNGAPNLARFLFYKPLKSSDDLTIPTLLIAAEKEQFFKNEEHSHKVYNKLHQRANMVTKYHVIKNIDHYGIYFDGYKEGSSLAVEWFNKYLQ